MNKALVPFVFVFFAAACATEPSPYSYYGDVPAASEGTYVSYADYLKSTEVPESPDCPPDPHFQPFWKSAASSGSYAGLTLACPAMK